MVVARDLLLLPGFGEDTLGDGEGGVGRGHPTVDGALEEYLFYLFFRQAVADGGAHVHLQLVEAAQRDQRGEGDAAPRPAVQARAGPDLTPRVAGYEVLEVRGKLRRAFDGVVDVLVAKDLATDAHTAIVGRVFRSHLPSPVTGSRWFRISRVTPSGCSTFARCAALSITTRRASGIESRISSAWSTVAAGSSAPATTSVGARIFPSLSRKSASLRASQQPAYPSDDVLRNMLAADSTVSGRAARNSGVNQRSSTTSATEPTPSALTLLARASYISGSNRAAVQHSTRRSTRSGASLASHMPTSPPIERPQNEALSISNRSSSASASRPRCSIL